jgi:hypothetical protein
MLSFIEELNIKMALKLFSLSIPQRHYELVLPPPKLTAVFSSLKRKTIESLGVIKKFVKKIAEKIGQLRLQRQDSDLQTNPGRRFNFPLKKSNLPLKPILLVILLVAGFLLVVKFLTRNNQGSVAGETINVSDAKKTLDLNKEFGVPLKTSDGDELSSIKYLLEKAEIRDEIIYKGKRATAVEGRDFLIVNLKITNDYTKPIELRSRDYIRLSVNGNESEWLAPDIHNDPVEIQAISTKLTRVGFPINESDANLVLQVGEIDGEKEKIPLSF